MRRQLARPPGRLLRPAPAGAETGVAAAESLRDRDSAPAFASRPTRAWRTRPPSARGPASSRTSCGSISAGAVASSDPSGAGAGYDWRSGRGGLGLGCLFRQHAVGLHDPLADIRGRLVLERSSVLVVVRIAYRHGHVRPVVWQLYGFAARLEVDARGGIPPAPTSAVPSMISSGGVTNAAEERARREHESSPAAIAA